MRTMFFGRVPTTVAIAFLASFGFAACGDDANDAGVASRRLEARLAEAEPTTDPATEPTTDPTTVPISEPTVEPTGVLVPVIGLDNSFRPQVVEVNVGDEVVWENRGLNEHDVLMVQDSASPFGVEVADFQPGDVYSHVFTEPGEYHYYCSIHGNETVGMIGTVVVTG